MLELAQDEEVFVEHLRRGLERWYNDLLLRQANLCLRESAHFLIVVRLLAGKLVLHTDRAIDTFLVLLDIYIFIFNLLSSLLEGANLDLDSASDDTVGLPEWAGSFLHLANELKTQIVNTCLNFINVTELGLDCFVSVRLRSTSPSGILLLVS